MDAMPTEYALLGLLLDGPKHGYELARRFAPETVLGEVCRLEMSMLYALLKKQERAAHIEAELESQGSRPPKRVFHLTGAGRAAFMEWIRTPVRRSREIRLDFLVKLYFARQVGTEDVLSLLDRQIEVCQGLLERLQQARYAEVMGYNAFEDDAAEFARTVQSHHPRPPEHMRNHNPSQPEMQFTGLVQNLRIKQNEAIIEWLRISRNEFGQI